MDTKYLIIIGGTTLLLFIIFQILSGLKLIKVDYKWHKYIGIGIALLALVHAVIGLVYIWAK
jgi:hypothetical protein